MADLYGLEASGLPPDLLARYTGSQGKKKIAEALLQSSMSPLQVPSGNISWTQGLAKLVEAYAGRKSADKADEELRQIAQDRKTMVADAMNAYQRSRAGTPEQTAPFVADAFPGEDPIAGLKTITQPAVAPDKEGAYRAAMASGLPEMGRIAETDFKLDARKEDREDQQAFKKDQLKAQTEARALDRAAQIAAQKERADADRIARDEQNKRDNETRRWTAQVMADVKQAAIDAKNNKPTQLPPAVLKMQMEAADAISTASGINERLDKALGNLESGKMDLGVMGRSEAFLRNNLNMSNEKTRNLASFQADLEKLRNDSLRLNKGVQTEGDAQRAWNELVANINDAGVVKQRLAEIKGINDRAIEMRKREIDVIRANSGLEPLDLTPFEGKSKMGADGAPMPKSGPARVTNAAEYNALKPGTRYIDPDGNERVKK